MILCHKCSGILTAGATENTAGLDHCGCISSYVRGFEPVLDRSQAITVQIDRCNRRIAWMTGRQAEGDAERCEQLRQRIVELTNLTR